MKEYRGIRAVWKGNRIDIYDADEWIGVVKLGARTTAEMEEYFSLFDIPEYFKEWEEVISHLRNVEWEKVEGADESLLWVLDTVADYLRNEATVEDLRAARRQAQVSRLDAEEAYAYAQGVSISAEGQLRLATEQLRLATLVARAVYGPKA